MADTAFYCILSHEGVLAVRGPDANKFLQGQVTCNLNYLSDSYSSLGARCTPKGRMQSSFRILSVSDGYLLAMASDLLDAQLTDLKKYAVFSKSKLTDESQDWLRIGLNGADDILRSLGLELAATADSVARRDDLLALRLSDGRAELWIPADQATAVQAQVASQLPEAPLNDWLLAQVRAGIGQVVGSTRELFIPQMINLQAVGGVSFKKGCYTGQEIVARTHYLGSIKRRTYLAHANQATQPGDNILNAANETVGKVVRSAPAAQGGYDLLAEVRCAEIDLDNTASSQLTANGHALVLKTLPYAL